LTGIKVSAARDRETFEALGFKDNDVVLNINGAPLTNPQDGVKLMDALADTNTATVTVLRDGAQHSISLDTTRLRSILENRE
jgi:general secretion pathway protein C